MLRRPAISCRRPAINRSQPGGDNADQDQLASGLAAAALVVTFGIGATAASAGTGSQPIAPAERLGLTGVKVAAVERDGHGPATAPGQYT